MILTQTAAMLVDAYRELNARKLFWITIGLNLVVDHRLRLPRHQRGGRELPGTGTSTPRDEQRVHLARTVLQAAVRQLGHPVWLSWVATILALVSTASIIPDLVSGGSIETMVSKPISRVRLFLTKYATGLLFAVLQVGRVQPRVLPGDRHPRRGVGVRALPRRPDRRAVLQLPVLRCAPCSGWSRAPPSPRCC
jgi:hypothetical protein